jgi:ferredoxin
MREENIVNRGCKAEPGTVIPFIDPTLCEGKGPCIPICPYNVLVMRIVPEEDRKGLPFKARMKLRVHGGKQAYAPDPNLCRACGLCVQVCPEDAITLRKR